LVNRLVVENLKHRPIRTLLSILAIAIQVTMVLTLVGVSNGMLEEQARRSRGIGADIVVRAPGGSALLSMSAGNLTDKFVPFIEKQPHVTAASGVLFASSGFLSAPVTGIDLTSFARLNGGFRFMQGGPFQEPYDIIIDDYYARQNKLAIGDHTQLLNQPWRVCGIVEPGILARTVVPLDTLQKLTANTGKISAIYVKVDKPANIQPTIAALKKLMPDYGIIPMEELISQISVNSIPMLKEFINVVIGLGVLIGFLVVFLSMYTAVLERAREIGVLKALGASPIYVINILLRETFLLAVCGSILGILLTFGTRFLINDVIHGSLIQAVVPVWWPIAAAIAIIGALLGATYPGLKAARQNAIEALAYE
jgi:putative ABC transport system permease protein